MFQSLLFKMDEMKQLDFYLSELRSLRTMSLSVQQVDTLERSIETMKSSLHSVTRLRLKHSQEMLEAHDAIVKLRQESNSWERLAQKMMKLLEGANKQIASLDQSVVQFFQRVQTASASFVDETPHLETTEEVQSPSEHDNENDIEMTYLFDCGDCPRKFRRISQLFRHESIAHGLHSAKKMKRTPKTGKSGAKKDGKRHTGTASP